MTSSPKEQPSTEAPQKGGLSHLEFLAGAAVFGGILTAAVCVTAVAPHHARVAGVITAKIRASGNLESCSVLVNTVRHEGKCGAFGPYTALVGGNALYVLSGPNDDPTLVGATGRLFGFRATKELADLALAE